MCEAWEGGRSGPPLQQCLTIRGRFFNLSSDSIIATYADSSVSICPALPVWIASQQGKSISFLTGNKLTRWFSV